MKTYFKRIAIHCIFFLTALPLPVSAQINQKSQNSAGDARITYADLLDLALASDAVATVHIKKSVRVADKRAPGLAPGQRRFFVSATVTNLIRGARSLPARITYLVDLAPDSKGRFTRLDGGDAILFADRVPGFDNELRLVAPDGQLGATPARMAQVRTALAEAAIANAPGQIASISGAFHLPGPIPGEGESQFFMTTDQSPMSISVTRMPGAAPRWWIALGEVVDQGLQPPKRDTFLWYRLACFLPRALPVEAKADSDPSLHAALDADYKVVLDGLGVCPRTLKRPPTP
jgi:hypothetical protein